MVNVMDGGRKYRGHYLQRCEDGLNFGIIIENYFGERKEKYAEVWRYSCAGKLCSFKLRK